MLKEWGQKMKKRLFPKISEKKKRSSKGTKIRRQPGILWDYKIETWEPMKPNKRDDAREKNVLAENTGSQALASNAPAASSQEEPDDINRDSANELSEIKEQDETRSSPENTDSQALVSDVPAASPQEEPDDINRESTNELSEMKEQDETRTSPENTGSQALVSDVPAASPQDEPDDINRESMNESSEMKEEDETSSSPENTDPKEESVNKDRNNEARPINSWQDILKEAERLSQSNSDDNIVNNVTMTSPDSNSSKKPKKRKFKKINSSVNSVRKNSRDRPANNNTNANSAMMLSNTKNRIDRPEKNNNTNASSAMIPSNTKNSRDRPANNNTNANSAMMLSNTKNSSDRPEKNNNTNASSAMMPSNTKNSRDRPEKNNTNANSAMMLSNSKNSRDGPAKNNTNANAGMTTKENNNTSPSSLTGKLEPSNINQEKNIFQIMLWILYNKDSLHEDANRPRLEMFTRKLGYERTNTQIEKSFTTATRKIRDLIIEHIKTSRRFTNQMLLKAMNGDDETLQREYGALFTQAILSILRETKRQGGQENLRQKLVARIQNDIKGSTPLYIADAAVHILRNVHGMHFRLVELPQRDYAQKAKQIASDTNVFVPDDIETEEHLIFYTKKKNTPQPVYTYLKLGE